MQNEPMNIPALQGASFQEVQPDGRVLMPPNCRGVCNFHVEVTAGSELPVPIFILRPGAEPDTTRPDPLAQIRYDRRGWMELSPTLIDQLQCATACLVFVGQGEYFEVWLDTDWAEIQEPLYIDWGRIQQFIGR